MQFSDTTNNLGIIQACEDYCGLGITGISSDANKLKEFTRYSNRASRLIWHWIFLSQGVWQYDDSNESGQPQGTANLVSGTAVYALPTGTLTVRRVEIKDSNGNWVKLNRILIDQIPNAVDEYQDTDGTPNQYRLIGDEIELFPAPNYASTDGLKVYFDRASTDFASTDTTQTPGFASPYHDLVAIGASMEWLKAKRPDSATLANLRNDWAEGKIEVSKFYAQRDKSTPSKISRKRITKYR
jgi:hypothetical protein